MNIRIRLIFLILAFSTPTFNHSQEVTDFKQGVYNIGIGGLIGGVGAVINKKQEEKTGKTFVRGFLQGALGGFLVFESKQILREFSTTDNYGYAWPSKLVNAAGNSIIENAAYNNPYWENWHLNIGFNRIDFHPRKSENKITYRIMPFSLIATISNFRFGKLNLTKSIKTGVFVFSAKEIKSHFEEVKNPKGIANHNSITIAQELNELSRTKIIAHELIHTYQYEELSGINAFLQPLYQKINSKSKLIKFYHKYFYTDWNAIYFWSLYNLNHEMNGYSNNFYEKEANHFSDLD